MAAAESQDARTCRCRADGCGIDYAIGAHVDLMKLSAHTSVRSFVKYARVSDEGLLNFQADTGEEHDEH
ncbi:hypothetical protein [Nocardia brasiliensis]|uniref:hypothetical protein n=1 Tax=Nocardia brasiliensis TaxID=37326 RepID=UPI00366BD31E